MNYQCKFAAQLDEEHPERICHLTTLIFPKFVTSRRCDGFEEDKKHCPFWQTRITLM